MQAVSWFWPSKFQQIEIMIIIITKNIYTFLHIYKYSWWNYFYTYRNKINTQTHPLKLAFVCRCGLKILKFSLNCTQ